MYFRRKGRDNNTAQLFRINSRLRQRLFRGLNRHTDVGTIGGEMTAFNTCARPNPLVVCVYDFTHIIVCYNLIRNIRCNREKFYTFHYSACSFPDVISDNEPIFLKRI